MARERKPLPEREDAVRFEREQDRSRKYHIRVREGYEAQQGHVGLPRRI